MNNVKIDRHVTWELTCVAESLIKTCRKHGRLLGEVTVIPGSLPDRAVWVTDDDWGFIIRHQGNNEPIDELTQWDLKSGKHQRVFVI